MVTWVFDRAGVATLVVCEGVDAAHVDRMRFSCSCLDPFGSTGSSKKRVQPETPVNK